MSPWNVPQGPPDDEFFYLPPDESSADPSVETWRATLGAANTAQLLQTQRDLAASQADLTAAEAENAGWRATAERSLAAQEQMARELATANYQNRILTAENEAAMRRLNEMEQRCPPTPPS